MINPEIRLRPATEVDAPAIRSLIRRVQINPTGIDWRRFELAVDTPGHVLGCGQLKPHRDGTFELASIAVEPARRGEGIARAIIEHLLDRAPRPLYLTCRSSLGSFYEKWKFRALAESEMPTYYRRLSRLAGRLMSLARHDEGLLVMVLQ